MTTKDVSNVRCKDKPMVYIKIYKDRYYLGWLVMTNEGSKGNHIMNDTNNDMNTEDENEENYIIKIRVIAQLMDLYDDTLDIKPNILRNKIQEKIQRIISELKEGKNIEFTAVWNYVRNKIYFMWRHSYIWRCQ